MQELESEAAKNTNIMITTEHLLPRYNRKIAVSVTNEIQMHQPPRIGHFARSIFPRKIGRERFSGTKGVIGGTSRRTNERQSIFSYILPMTTLLLVPPFVQSDC